jgi:hypothetical protein
MSVPTFGFELLHVCADANTSFSATAVLFWPTAYLKIKDVKFTIFSNTHVAEREHIGHFYGKTY